MHGYLWCEFHQIIANYHKGSYIVNLHLYFRGQGKADCSVYTIITFLPPSLFLSLPPLSPSLSLSLSLSLPHSLSPSLPPSLSPFSLDCLKWLVLHADGDPYIAAEDGMSAIHAAAQAGQLSCLRWLVEEAAIPVRQRSADGATPAHFAAASGEVWSP